MNRKSWTDDLIKAELLAYTSTLGRLPSVSELKLQNRNDLACAISKSGGWKRWHKEMGVELIECETTTGWKAENMAAEWLRSLGYDVIGQVTRAHFDLLVDGVLRIDVKGTQFARYGASSGWFYRMGKIITADMVICVRMDKPDFYPIPWFRVPSTNLTITPTGKAHSYYHMNTYVIADMLKSRKAECVSFPECSRTSI